MDTESDTGVSDVDSVVSSVTAPLRPAFPPIKKEKLADGSEVLSFEDEMTLSDYYPDDLPLLVRVSDLNEAKSCLILNIVIFCDTYTTIK